MTSEVNVTSLLTRVVGDHKFRTSSYANANLDEVLSEPLVVFDGSGRRYSFPAKTILVVFDNPENPRKDVTSSPEPATIATFLPPLPRTELYNVIAGGIIKRKAIKSRGSRRAYKQSMSE